MFLTPGIEVVSVGAATGALARVASDHLPLVAELILPFTANAALR